MATKKAKGRNPDKPHVWLSEELGTSLVAESIYHPDPRTLCQRYSISVKTLERWRTRVAADERLRGIVEEKQKAHAEVWEVGIRDCARELFAAILHHARLAQRSEAFEPDVMHKVVGALKTLNDAVALRQMIQPNPNGRVLDPGKGSSVPAHAGVGRRTTSGAIPAAATAGAPGSGPGAAPADPTGGVH